MAISKAHSIVGFGNDREPFDNYPTPSIAVTELLKREHFDGTIWECACGSGNIAKFFPDCIATDIRESGYGEGGINFLLENRKVDNIITNPPFKLAQQFVEHALVCANQKVAMFLKLVFLESESRYYLFKDHPPKIVYPFSKRLTLKREGEEREMSGMIAYAWFVWDKSYNGKTTIEWILVEDKHSNAKSRTPSRRQGA